jgi:putative Mg2+ transporter-C (MgtC) family protein
MIRGWTATTKPQVCWAIQFSEFEIRLQRPKVGGCSIEWNTQIQLIGEVALAMLLDGIIGIDREIADKPADLRTHMLIAEAAALLVALGGAMLYHFKTSADVNLLRSDSIRVIEAIIIGVSFLGAGTIIRREKSEQVEGLTTAASMIFSAAVGTCIAMLQIVLALGVTGLALLTLRGLGFIERHWKQLTPTEKRLQKWIQGQEVNICFNVPDLTSCYCRSALPI